MRKIDYSDLRWNGNEYEIYAGYPLGHISLNAEIDNLEQYREITSGISLDRLREICDAERDGRMVVLPCKVGDNAWWLTGNRLIKCRIHRIQINKCGLYVVLKSKVVHGAYHTDRFGKTVFLTREEAEAALRKEQSDEA